MTTRVWRMSSQAWESGGRADEAPTVLAKPFSELTAAELHEILQLRSQVFVVEQECVYNDIDGRDVEVGTTHIWAEANGRPAAYLRTLSDETPEGNIVRVGRVVTRPDNRGHGLAAHLMKSVISESSAPIVLDAQSHLHDWYARLGFVQDGDEYIEDGIAHIPMRRSHPVE